MASIFWNLSEGVSNLNRVVTELLEYTKTLRLNLSSQKIDLILRETMDVFQAMINQNAITVEEHYGTELSPLSVDAVLIGQVFQNIIHNAIEAMPDGGRLSLTSGFFRQEPEYAIISISDTGVSLKASEIEKIFRPFYTTKNSGIGLGLSLAHRIIEAHKGKIWVCQNPCSHLGTGSREIITSRAATSQSKGVTVHILLPTAGKQHELTDT
ncbi:MAG: hypothetical protein GTO12_16605 [Proteobacteria bacterium]|nr:hypothetical protein [Pseudomonadota bacterium]